MNIEQKTEIIKSLAMGMPALEIAYLEDVTEAEVEAVRSECAAEIAERRARYEGN